MAEDKIGADGRSSALTVTRYFDRRTKNYILEARYIVGAETRRRLGVAGVLDNKLFYEESGGLPFGIIGSIPDVMIYGLVNELAKKKLSITAKSLLDGMRTESQNFTEILALEAAIRKAATSLDGLLNYMSSFPEIETTVEEPKFERDRTLRYRGKMLPVVREKTGLMSFSDFYEYEGRRFPSTDISKLVEVLDKEYRESLLQKVT